jgi:hypothetical protein
LFHNEKANKDEYGFTRVHAIDIFCDVERPLAGVCTSEVWPIVTCVVVFEVFSKGMNVVSGSFRGYR